MNLAIRAYIGAVCVLATFLAVRQDWTAFVGWAAEDYWGFATLIVLGIAAEQQALTIKVGRIAGGSSIAFLPLLTIVLLFGPTPAVVFYIVGGVIAEYLIRHKEPWRANFNVGQYVASTALGGAAFTAAGGEALITLDDTVRSSMILEQFGPFVLFGVVFLVVNNAFVAGVMALSQGMKFRETWRHLVGASGTNLLLDLLIGPIAIAVATLYLQIGPTGLLLAILPLFFIRHSYQTTQELQVANRDLLKALVKAIETRDPYTSGHSLRVSHLAKTIAEQLGLARTAVERIEVAALLHDIGKIEATYADILGKPDSLTPEERATIQSHVTRGEELLRDLASVPEDVVKAVRHHHEREDGSGYPDGLRGAEIPIGARIIVVCDAVDAMLSDRPYRRALPVSVVLRQLREHSGRQFDSVIVDALLDSDVLRGYAHAIRVSRVQHSAEVGPPTGEASDRAAVARWPDSAQADALVSRG